MLFSLHCWEFASWIVNTLSRNYAVIIERYVWSGTVYSWASNPMANPYQYMILDAGLPQPDLVVCIDTPFSDVLSRGGIVPSLFVDIELQQQLRTCYADPRKWKGINVVMHETQLNRWASRKTLIRRIQGELLLRSRPKSWVYLWEQNDICSTCCVDLNPRQPMFRCFRCTRLIHFECLMENSSSQKIPICQACASGSNQEPQEEEALAVVPLEEAAIPLGRPSDGASEEVRVELRDPYLNPLEDIVMDTGSIPCSIHGHDHLSRDPTCEFCKRALGPLYRHLSKKYGKALGDQTPTLSFDFSGPHPVAVTGARFMLLFVWRLDALRLLWAFAVTGKTKECV